MEPLTLALIFFAVGAGAISKGATGMGMPLIAIPFLASSLGLQHAIADHMTRPAGNHFLARLKEKLHSTFKSIL